jgi:DNA-binding CsgD family transcriptional regulator
MDAATAWLAVAADVLAEPDPVRARQTLTDALIARTDAGLVSRIALSHADPDGIDIAVVGEMFHPGPDLLPTAAQVRGHPLTRYHCATGDSSPVLMPDVLASGWKLDPVSEAVMRDLRISEHQLSIPVGGRGDYDGWVLVAETPFAERAMDEVGMVHRLLTGLDAHLRVLGRVHDQSSSDAATPPSLTPRERVILTLLAQGSTAQAIAWRLEISPRTVHKHQEHLYRKLGAFDRLSAVLAAQKKGLLPRQHP